MNKMKAILLVFTLFLAPAMFCFAGEGMWLPLFLKQLNEAEMKSMGMKISAEDIYSVNKGSLKDAIVHFGGGCTAEIISSEGLLLTNHHCGYGQIQRHSSVEKNYIDDGFWAKTRGEELSNPGLTITLISRIEDVTNAVLQGVTDNMDPIAKKALIEQNLVKAKGGATIQSFEDAFIRSFFHGNQYFMFVTVTYKDIRLVGTPPSSIGKFGADTDNWEWPRHTGDFALFRIYAGPDNLPADYSPDNVPYKPKHFLPISLDGVQEGDFTMVFGFPGRTDQYLPASAVRQTVEVLNPLKINIREQVLKIMDAAMRADVAIKVKYASKQASIANAWKKWIGESQGIRAVGALAKKEAYESSFTKKVQSNKEWKSKYGNVLNDLNAAYAEIEEYAAARDFMAEILGRNSDLIRIAGLISNWDRILQSQGADAAARRMKADQLTIEGIYKNMDIAVDKDIFSVLMALTAEKMNRQFVDPHLYTELNKFAQNSAQMASVYYTSSVLADSIRFMAVMNTDPASALKTLSEDPVFVMYQKLNKTYQETVTTNLSATQNKINDLMTVYMRAQMEVFPDKKFWPDANSTMRVTYGKVAGYQARDAVRYYPKTYLSGVLEKYVPGDYEFEVPEWLISLSRNKDFGEYADETGDVPVCFLGSNHTTGGNSGSPAIDAYGNLVGLNFDRVWEGTMSDLNYDEKICRNIMVDARYILFIIDKFAGAKHLVDEMKLVYPKSKKIRPNINKPPKMEKTQMN